jgi:cell division protein ZapE
MTQGTPLQLYQQRVDSGSLSPDDAQLQAAEALEGLYNYLLLKAKYGILHRLADNGNHARGLYIWGDVGRGKSMLMDLFVQSITPFRRTKRVHFHAFMRDTHARLHAFRQLRSQADVMPKVIRDIAQETQVLCLDELQVTDVTDAMILARLFSGLIDAGVAIVFTSNRAPRDLYQGGLQREQFLQFVSEVVEGRLEIHELRSEHDYRMEKIAALTRVYMYPRCSAADDFLLESWHYLVGDEQSEPLQLKIHGRNIEIEKHVRGVAWLTFAELCMRPLGASDYLEIVKNIHTLLLQGIPKLSAEQRNEAKRFVTLIDALYDNKIKLICTAQTAPEEIYLGNDGGFEFARTVSRLHEMQSESYLMSKKSDN